MTLTLYDSVSMRRFAGIDLGEMPVPDESTVLRFRHLLEAHGLGEKLFEQVHGYLERQGIKIGTGTIVDATIISAPPSTKNKDKCRDPDMHPTKKGNQWYFGMKRTSVWTVKPSSSTRWSPPRPMCTTRCVCPISCTGRRHASGATRPIRGRVRSYASTHRRPPISPIDVTVIQRAKNKTKSSVRAKVEHPFLIIKRIFGFVKTRYKGLAKRARPKDGPAWRPEDGAHTACSSPVR